MPAWEPEIYDELYRRADEAITASQELTAQARADLDRAWAYLRGAATSSRASRHRYQSN